MFYLWIAIFAYLLFAVNAVIDKFLLTKRQLGHPGTYAFVVGILSLSVVVLAPLGFARPSGEMILLSLFTGALFVFALLLFFGALQKTEASRLVPVQGGLVPLFTLLLAYLFLGERLGGLKLAAFGFLVAGGVLISWEFKKRKPSFPAEIAVGAILAAILFASHFTLAKQVFSALGFINGLIWTRFGMALAAAGLLLDEDIRDHIFQTKKPRKPRLYGLLLGGQVIGALGGLLQNYAISLGPVSIVNALTGVQFVFVLALVAAFSRWHPRVLKEKTTPGILWQKAVAILLIAGGIAALAI